MSPRAHRSVLVAAVVVAMGSACGSDPNAARALGDEFLPSTSGSVTGTFTLLDSPGGDSFPALRAGSQLLVSLFADRSFPPAGPPNVTAVIPLAGIDEGALARGVPQAFPYRLDETTGLVNGTFSVAGVLDVDGNGLFDLDEAAEDCATIVGVFGPPPDPLPVAVTVTDGSQSTLDLLLLPFFCGLF